MSRRRFPFFIAISLLSGLSLPSVWADSDWKVIKVGHRDYLGVDNIAKFYDFFSSADPAAKRVHLANSKNDINVLLDSREILINGVRNWLSFPVIEKDGEYLVSRVDLAKTLEPQLRPQMIPDLGKVTTVVLDAGHGGYDKGATSRYGCEKNFTLDVAKQLRPLLQAQGFKVILTRENDVFVPLEMRARIANNTKDSIFVSIHFNAADRNPDATGFEIFSLTPVGSPSTADDGLALSFMNRQAGNPVDAPSLELSTSIYHSLLGHLSEFDRGIKRARFAVLRLTKRPAVLIEGGFLTERGESRLIANKDWRGKLAEAISVGIKSYRDLAENKKRPMLMADYRHENSGQLTARDATAPAANPSPTPAVLPVSN
jgi:N-acetylmuramoyl-L-alanine amidase